MRSNLISLHPIEDVLIAFGAEGGVDLLIFDFFHQDLNLLYFCVNLVSFVLYKLDFGCHEIGLILEADLFQFLALDLQADSAA